MIAAHEIRDSLISGRRSWSQQCRRARMLSAQLVFEQGDVEKTRRALDRTEASVIAILEGVHEMCIRIGDMEE
ncbi:hypothetical protein [Streptomyces asiaticus]|uniref:hypothetical protein n=1 Tax=Streptomyces asiaticus TaxID=114695 RepID=UPI00374D8B1C